MKIAYLVVPRKVFFSIGVCYFFLCFYVIYT